MAAVHGSVERIPAASSRPAALFNQITYFRYSGVADSSDTELESVNELVCPY